MKTFWPKIKTFRRSEGSGFSKRQVSNPDPTKKSKRGRLVDSFGKILAIAILALVIGGILLFVWLAFNMPDPNRLTDRNMPQSTKIYDRTGEHVIYEFHGDQKRTLVELENISKYVIDATIASEDKNFYIHHGFQIKGILRSVYINLTTGQKVGGSTITQQLVKNAILTGDKKYTRKIKELILSLEIERRFEKDEILKMYLNEIPYGSLTYGIESAAQTFFGKNAKDLTLDESALLVILPRATTRFSPYGSHRDELIEKQRAVLDSMVELGYITGEEAGAAKEVDVLSKIVEEKTGLLAPHFVFYVRERLASTFGEQAVEEGGLKVITTLDYEKQEAANQAVADNIDFIKEHGGNSAALIAIEPSTGDIMAMIGSADYFDDSINGKYNALTGRLQPGSSIKPIVYAYGFEKGYTPNTVLYDVSTDFSVGSSTYRPRNYDGKEHGAVTVREALGNSMNIPAVKMLYLVGLKDFIDFATENIGYNIPDPSQIGLSLTLGGATVNPIEHINAYSAFANEGKITVPRSILKVEDSKGKVMYEAEKVKLKEAISTQSARMINDVLSDDNARAMTFGTGSVLTLGERPVAAKTGTTNDYKDAWTIGYTPSLVAGVWVGEALEGKSMDSVGGSRAAGPIWNQFMREALSGSPIEYFTKPDEVITGKAVLDGDKTGQLKVKIDKFSGKLATEYTPEDQIEEKYFGTLHTILHFVDRDDPRGEYPKDPTSDPQYVGWEAALADWATRNNITVTGEQPPTEYDDVHRPEMAPTVSFQGIYEGSEISTRQPTVQVNAYAPRVVASVEYWMSGELVGKSEQSPFTSTLTIPNKFPKGFHQLCAVARDDVGNRNENYCINVNLTAEVGGLGLIWQNLYDSISIENKDFPYLIRVSIPDFSSIESLALKVEANDGEVTEIGSVKNPSLPSMAFSWNEAKHGSYTIIAEAEIVGGTMRESRIRVEVR